MDLASTGVVYCVLSSFELSGGDLEQALSWPLAAGSGRRALTGQELDTVAGGVQALTDGAIDGDGDFVVTWTDGSTYYD